MHILVTADLHLEFWKQAGRILFADQRNIISELDTLIAAARPFLPMSQANWTISRWDSRARSCCRNPEDESAGNSSPAGRCGAFP